MFQKIYSESKFGSFSGLLFDLHFFYIYCMYFLLSHWFSPAPVPTHPTLQSVVSLHCICAWTSLRISSDFATTSRVFRILGHIRDLPHDFFLGFWDTFASFPRLSGNSAGVLPHLYGISTTMCLQPQHFGCRRPPCKPYERAGHKLYAPVCS